ncbi:biopolymer transporter ExbD [bacterium]|nr:biopolymer transporter ExbD [bacterium]
MIRKSRKHRLGKRSFTEGTGEVMGEINITPLTDVLLVLLIIFLVTATAASQTAFNMNLPLGSAQANLKVVNDTVIMSIDEKSNIYVQEEKKPVPHTSLVSRLKLYQVKKGTDKAAVRAASKTPYGTVVMAIDAAKQAGLEKVVLVTE